MIEQFVHAFTFISAGLLGLFALAMTVAPVSPRYRKHPATVLARVASFTAGCALLAFAIAALFQLMAVA